ncbi:MAG: PepSY domain-containing protein [Nitrospira sp.]|nr:PepSY domain-containing protein [Nitrospira sp.]MDH4305779.1 PepSY domain-containing protein [Nitrospira sp.]MDH5195442.1 PepSY domain-containing protein [Nitrospira sp.]
MCKALSIKVALAALLAGTGIMPLIDQVLAEPNKAEKSASAKVSIVEAITTASEKVTGAVIEARLEQRHDRLIWEVEVITPEKQVMEIHIDAQTGTVIEVEEKVKSKRIHRWN